MVVPLPDFPRSPTSPAPAEPSGSAPAPSGLPSCELTPGGRGSWRTGFGGGGGAAVLLTTPRSALAEVYSVCGRIRLSVSLSV